MTGFGREASTDTRIPERRSQPQNPHLYVVKPKETPDGTSPSEIHLPQNATAETHRHGEKLTRPTSRKSVILVCSCRMSTKPAGLVPSNNAPSHAQKTQSSRTPARPPQMKIETLKGTV